MMKSSAHINPTPNRLDPTLRAQDKTCLVYPCPREAEENPYVQMDNTVAVDKQALEDARRMSEERRGSGAGAAKK
jgi:hypothetical protein